jgi:hypothetical protein
LLSAAIVPALYILLFRKPPFRLHRVGFAFSFAAAGLALVSAGIYNGPSSLFQFFFTLLYMRTFCMVGVLMSFYTEFFQTHPYTYFSHINVVRAYVPYPYSEALGNVIGHFMVPEVGGQVMDANASFLATDGMAALGFAGVVLSGIFFRIFIGIFNVAVDFKVLALGCCALVPLLMSVTNASLFSSLLTNGGGVLAVVLYFYGNASPARRV